MSFSLNNRSLFSQPNPALVALSSGSYIIVWESEYQDGMDWGIYGQRYDSNGNSVGSEFLVNTTTKDSQTDPAVISLPDGGFLVAWQSRNFGGSENDIFAQRFDADSNPLGGEFLLNTTLTDFQEKVDLISLNHGGFVAVWESDEQDGDDEGVYGQIYNTNGETVNAEFEINTYTAKDQGRPAITSLADGGFAVFWQSEDQDRSEYGIYGQHFDSSGRALGSEFQVNTEKNGSQNNPEVTTLNNGSVVVTWRSYAQDGDDYGIFAQRYDSSGTAVGSEFQVNTVTANNQISPSIAPLSNGGFVVTWRSLDGTGEYNVKGQRYDSDGTAVGSEFQVNTFLSADRSDVPVTGLPGGGFVVTWHSLDPTGRDYGTWQRRYDASGNPITEPQQVNTYTHEIPVLDTTILSGDEVTITIAAYNTPNPIKADWQATGENDQNLINSAIAQINAAGKGIVRLLPGTYNISNNILLQSNVALQGSGWQTRLRLVNEATLDNAGIIRTLGYTAGGGDDAIYNATIANLQIDGNKANQSSSSNKYGVYGNYTNSFMDHIYIRDTSSYGFDPHEVSETGRPTTNLTIRNSLIENAGLDGITLDKLVDSQVINNLTINNARHGINIVTNTENTEFFNNVSIGNAGNGITVQNGSRNLNIIGNEVRENGRYGIYIDQEGGNTITQNATFLNQRGGIQIKRASGNTISNNLVGNNSQVEHDRYSEIELTDDEIIYSIHNTVEGNIVYSSLSNRARYGIREKSIGDNDNTIIENIVTGAVQGDYSLKGNNSVLSGTTVNQIQGTFDPDYLMGTGDPGWLIGLEGDDTLDGNSGNDFLDGGEGQDFFLAGKGSDFLIGGAGNDYLDGSSDDDYLNGGEDNDQLYGTSGNDRLEGGNGNDLLDGGSGRDFLYGQGRIDFLNGRSGNDYLWGGTENDTLEGSTGNDYLNGGIGDDNLDGGSDDDILDGEEGDDQLKGYFGKDFLKGGAGDDNLLGNEGTDYLEGGSGNDSLAGDENEDYLLGNKGNDILNGGEGNDIIDGGMGSDTFTGGGGNDWLSLGNDLDRDSIFYSNGNGTDIVEQFTLGSSGDALFFEKLSHIDVVTHNDYTNFHASDGMMSFGSGELLVTLQDITTLTSSHVGTHLLISDEGEFRFSDSFTSL